MVVEHIVIFAATILSHHSVVAFTSLMGMNMRERNVIFEE